MGAPGTVIGVLPPTGKEFTPGLQAVISQLESQLIVPKLPAELTPESLEKYKQEVALAKEFNAAIVAQIDALRG
ncbi:hypothetical protein D9M68_738600 [compost metagenome]